MFSDFKIYLKNYFWCLLFLKKSVIIHRCCFHMEMDNGSGYRVCAAARAMSAAHWLHLRLLLIHATPSLQTCPAVAHVDMPLGEAYGFRLRVFNLLCLVVLLIMLTDLVYSVSSF